MYDINMAENLTLKALEGELYSSNSKLKSLKEEYEQNIKIIESLLNSIEKRKIINPHVRYDGFKELMLINQREHQNSFIIADIEKLNNYIEKIKCYINTYQKRYNKKFGRKSPFIILNFGYDVTL